MFNKFSKLISPNQKTVLRVMNFCQSCPGRRSNRTYVDMCRQAVAVVASVLDFGALWAGMAGGRPLPTFDHGPNGPIRAPDTPNHPCDTARRSRRLAGKPPESDIRQDWLAPTKAGTHVILRLRCGRRIEAEG